MSALVSQDENNSMIPGFMISIALNFVASCIGEQRNCSLLDKDPGELIPRLEIPVVFLAARKDDLCPLSTAREMFNALRGKKEYYLVQRKSFIDFEGTHLSMRHQQIYQQTLEYILVAIAENHGLITPAGVHTSPMPTFRNSPKGVLSNSMCLIDFPESPSQENIPSLKHMHTPRRSPYSLTLLRPLNLSNNENLI